MTIKAGTLILLVAHGKVPTPKGAPPIGATGAIAEDLPDEQNRYKVNFPKEVQPNWKVKRNLFIILNDGNLDKESEEHSNPYKVAEEKQKGELVDEKA